MNLTDQYNKLAFLTPTIVDLCDSLAESTECKRELKFHINRANIEAQKVLAKHYMMYANHGAVANNQGGKEVSAEDIYNITAKAYDFLFNKSPREICCIAQIIADAEAKGLDYEAVEIPYQPIL